MKRVQYLAGLAGLAPAAFGLGTAPAAHAATHTVVRAAPAAGAEKAVSLHHVLGHGYAAAAATGAVASSGASASSAASIPASYTGSSGASTTGDCTGSTPTSTAHGNLYEKFWYTTAPLRVCIGTVEGQMLYFKHIDKCMWGRIYHSGKLRFVLSRVCGTRSAGDALSATWRVKRYFPGPVKVCVKSTYDTVGACRSVLSREDNQFIEEARMKRVHYLAGMAGLAPAAFGLAMGPAAHAATQAAHGAARTATDQVFQAPRDLKTVSMFHVRAAAGPQATATSSSSGTSTTTSSPSYPATSPSANATGCDGTVAGKIPRYKNTRGHFWYTNSGCLGTVVASMLYNKDVYKCEAVSILSPDGTRLAPERGWCNSGTKGHWQGHTLAYHEYFPYPVYVCLFSTYRSKTPAKYCGIG
jgi:hypothetical protein